MTEHKLEKFTPTMICDYMNCPRLFYYRYIAKIQIPQKQIHLLFGGGIHKAIEKGIYGKSNPYEIFENHFDKNKLMEEEKHLHKDHLDLGKEMLTNYKVEHETLNNLYNLNSGKSEVYVRRRLINPLTGNISSLPMSGVIDRLTDAGKIVEYKTAKNKWNQKDLNFKAQTYLYNLWFFSEYGEMPEDTLYFILLKKFKKKEKDEILQTLQHRCTLTDLASVFDEVELILEKIDNRDFNRPKGYHPDYCDCHLYERYLNFEE